jgi:shikimate dehydrogenase
MYPKCPATPLPLDDMRALHSLAGVLDVVYNPALTGICLDARRLHIPFQSGLAMLVSQALYSSELFQGRTLDRSLVASIESQIRRQTQNVILIGMPGVGKTTTGRALAHLLGRPFVDLDDAFRLEYGTGAGDYIRLHGEDAFRELETRVAADYGSRSSLVIACGGGIVTRSRNEDLLRQNGTIVLLERPLESLPKGGRPISQAKGLEQLARERMPLYRAWADVDLRCTGTASGDARAIVKMIGC